MSYNSKMQEHNDGLREILNTINALPAAVEQATPSIAVSAGGLITATAVQQAGKVAAGQKSATKQLTTKAGTTVTPTTTEQTVVTAGTYVTGDIKVAAVDDSGNSGGLETCEVYIYNMQDSTHSTYTTVEGDTVAVNTVTGYLDTTFTGLVNSVVVICAPYYMGYNTFGSVELYDEWYETGLLVFWIAGDGGISLY